MSASNGQPRRLRVVTLIDTVRAGGAERLAVQIAARLDPERFESTLCASRWEARERSAGTDALLAELEAAGGELLPLHREGKADVWRWAPLLRRLRGGTDVVHSHVFSSNAWGAVLGRATRVPVVVAHEHTWSFEGAPVRKAIDREVIARLSDVFVSCSREDERRMIEIERIAPEKIHLIPNGIEAPPPRDDPHDVRAELGIPADAPVLVAVGRLVPDKGFDVLIAAAAELAPRFPGLRVLIAGTGEQRDALQAQIAAAGLDGTVTLLGVRSDVPDLLDAADVAVSSSRVEGSPLAVIEQMAAGRAIVAAAVGGVPDLIEDGVHGLLVPSDDAPALAGAIATLLDDPDRRAALGSAARERRRAEFDLATMVGRVEALYERLAATKGLPTRTA